MKSSLLCRKTLCFDEVDKGNPSRAFIAYGSWYNTGVAGHHEPIQGVSQAHRVFKKIVKPSIRALVSTFSPDSGIDGHAVAVEELSEDFSSVKQSDVPNNQGAVTVTASGNEAPVMFQRVDEHGVYWWYLIYGTLCCFCADGGDAKVKIALDPMGPWSDVVTNINPWENDDGTTNLEHIPGQNSGVWQVALQGAGEVDDVYVFYVDRWQQAPSGRKGDDIQGFFKLHFEPQSVTIDGVSHEVPIPQRLQLQEVLTVDGVDNPSASAAAQSWFSFKLWATS